MRHDGNTGTDETGGGEPRIGACLATAAAMLLALLLTSGAWAEQEGTVVETVALQAVPVDPPRLVPGDEIDQLAETLAPPARFADHQPRWRVERRTFQFNHFNRVEESNFAVVFDGERVVAVVRSGDIMLIARTPDTAPTRLPMPTERLHLDNLPGPSLPTWQFIKNMKTHGTIYAELGDKVLPRETWELGPRSLAFVRRQTLPEYDVVARFVFTVDPVFGYRIDAVRDVSFAQPPAKGLEKMGGGSFCPGCYVPWRENAIYDRTAWTPARGGIEGWANNLLTMDRCDSGKDFSWRDGGFIAYLPAADGWSPCFTRKDGTGNTPNLNLCNAHNDFHIQFIIKDLAADANGRYPFHAVHRLMSLPPELSGHVWNQMKLIQQGVATIIIKLGDVEDFEKQPVALTEPARGLVWTSGGPALAEDVGRNGGKSLLIRGRQWPNLPQVSLKPDVRYRLEGWFKVVPWTPEQLAKAKAEDARRREDLTKKNKPLPPAVDWDNVQPRAYIVGDFYEWSPYTGPMVEKQMTTQADGRTDQWQHVSLDFTAPAWGPFINIAFHADYCEAYLDDFALRELPDAAK